MARVEWAESALASLDLLILSHNLPPDTRDRIRSSLRPLGRFPRLGPQIDRLQEGAELRFVIGPWPWLVIVYIYDEARDTVIVVSPEDGRGASSTVVHRHVR